MSNNNIESTLPTLILDVGSNSFRMGWGGEDFPEIIAPSVYVDASDYIFNMDIVDGLEDIFFKDKLVNEYLFGREALRYQNILNLHEFWKESNYNILEKFFLYYYGQLNITPELQFKQPIVIISPSFMTELEKSKLQQIFIDNLKFPEILFLSESQAILSALQKTSGAVINIGENHTYITTILHGFTNIMARDVFPITGKDLTNYFLNLILTEKGSGRNLYFDNWLAKEIKEKTSLCILNAEEEKKRIKEGLTKYDQQINFPDGSELIINSERFMIAETFFNPSLIHINYISLAEAISKVVKTWERENWEEIIQNIIISGGTSIIPGIAERLKMELLKFFTDKIKNSINVIAVSGRENMGWIGASILYSKGQLTKGWIQNPQVGESKEVIDQENQQNLEPNN